MTIQNLHETMYTLMNSSYIEVYNLERKLIYSGYLRDLPFDIYSEAKVYGFNPDSIPAFYINYKEC